MQQRPWKAASVSAAGLMSVTQGGYGNFEVLGTLTRQ